MEPLTYSQIVTAAIALLAIIVSFRVQRQQFRLQQNQEELTNLQIAERRVPVKAEVSGDSLGPSPFMSDQA